MKNEHSTPGNEAIAESLLEFQDEPEINYVEFDSENLPVIDSMSLARMAGYLQDLDIDSARAEIELFCQKNKLKASQLGAVVDLRDSGGKIERHVISLDSSDFGVALLPESVVDRETSPLEAWVQAKNVQFVDKKELIDLDFSTNEATKDAVLEAVEDVKHIDGVDDSLRESAAEMLLTGSFGGKKMADGYNLFRDGDDAIDAREYLAALILSGADKADTARAIVETGACGVHSTGSAALMSIIESGQLQATTELYKNGINVVTGEHYYQGYAGQNSISFSNLSHIEASIKAYGRGFTVHEQRLGDFIATKAQSIDEFEAELDPDEFNHDANTRYIEQQRKFLNDLQQNPDSLSAEFAANQFSVCFFISGSTVEAAEELRSDGYEVGLFGTREYGEFRPDITSISLKNIPIIAVPEKYREIVQEQLAIKGFANTKVIAVESLLPDEKNRQLVPAPNYPDW